MKNNVDPYRRFQKLFDEFGVKDEEQLLQVLDAESHSLRCINCGTDRPFDDIVFVDGDPYCKYGCSY